MEIAAILMIVVVTLLFWVMIGSIMVLIWREDCGLERLVNLSGFAILGIGSTALMVILAWAAALTL